MAVAIAPPLEEVEPDVYVSGSASVDPLGFLVGRRYTCYCGRSVVGSFLCRDCAAEMTEYFAAARRRSRISIAPS
jgi:hypothetical protein